MVTRERLREFAQLQRESSEVAAALRTAISQVDDPDSEWQQCSPDMGHPTEVDLDQLYQSWSFVSLFI